MNSHIHIVNVLLTTLLILYPLIGNSQAVSVFGSGASARECYYSAQIAAQMNSASRSELKMCNMAIEHENLKLRDKAATYINRGILYAALEEYKNAAKDYSRAMALFPDFGAIYVNRGNLFFLGGLYEHAIEEYTKALDLELPADHVAYLNRGMAYEKLGQFVNAETDYRRAIEIYPQWALATTKLDRVLMKMN